ncbi:MAG: hypothetical protein LQ350_007429 [Teloschistes chrysophthalmus]|nr:MAG: hypothetical protein LQ350_007429 [Niorma chrysophthalma]
MAGTKFTQPLGLLKSTALLYCILSQIIQAHPLFLNTSLSSELQPHCTNYATWMNGGSFNPNDCLLALEKLEDSDFKIYKSRDIEFLARGAKSRTNLGTVRLPRSYTKGSCTIIFAMLGTITEHILPGQVRDADEYGSTDVSKFSYLWSVSAWVDGNCIAKEGRLGWCATGRYSNIGVFTFIVMTSESSDSQRSVISSNDSTALRALGQASIQNEDVRLEPGDPLAREMTPSTSLSGRSSQEAGESFATLQSSGTDTWRRPLTTSSNEAVSHSTQDPTPRSRDSMELMPTKPQAYKRTANGEVKPSNSNNNSTPTSPTGSTHLGHSRNASTASKGSQIGELSNELRTRLTYAMFKVQNGWQAHNIGEVEAMAARGPPPPFRSPQHHIASEVALSRTANHQNIREGQLGQGPLPNGLRSTHVSTQLETHTQSHSPPAFPQSPKFPALWQGHGADSTSITTSSEQLPVQGPTLAPPANIVPRKHQRPDQANLQPSRLDTSLSYKSGTEPIFSPLGLSTGPHTPQQRPTSSVRTPSQKTAMEQDAVETLIFMSSPGNTGHFSAFRGPTSPAQTRKHVDFALSRGDPGASTSRQYSSRKPSDRRRAPDMGRLTTASDVDKMLDQMTDEYSSSDEDCSVA